MLQKLIISATMAVMSLAGAAQAQDLMGFDRASFGSVVLSRMQAVGTGIQLELSVGSYENEPMSNYKDTVFADIGRSVGRLDVLTDKGTFPCTAFIVSKQHILTNYHCSLGLLDDERIGATRIDASQFVAGYTQTGVDEGTKKFTVIPTPVETNAELDYAVLEVIGNPSQEFGELKLASLVPKDRAPFWIIGHPQGKGQHISREKCRASTPAVSRNTLLHTCDTLPGNSGSPVIDAGLQVVVALHHAGIANDSVNAAILMSKILQHSTVLAAYKAPEEAPKGQPVEPKTAAVSACDALYSEAKEAKACYAYNAYVQSCSSHLLAPIAKGYINEFCKPQETAKVDKVPEKTCDNDPALCSTDQLCGQSLTFKSGKAAWRTDNVSYVSEAKRRGLSCGVEEIPIEQNLYTAAGPLKHPICLRVEKGSDFESVSRVLLDTGVIANVSTFLKGAQSAVNLDKLKAGSFLIPAKASMDAIAAIITRSGSSSCGTEIVYRIGVTGTSVHVRELDPKTNRFVKKVEFNTEDETAPEIYLRAKALNHTRFRVLMAEGVTSWRVRQVLMAIDQLTGDIATVPEEGTLAPDSYEIHLGETRQAVIERMQTAQAMILKTAWGNRVKDLPLKSRQEALILASIVEKETGLPTERKQIASVFINRLSRGIRLQTDPTVIYGITKGEKTLGRGLRRSELDRKTPWNTYRIDGLPLTPIANPGRGSIEAVLNPDYTNFLFFVADGTGGHIFAETLTQHNANVKKWRDIEAGNAKKTCSFDPLACNDAALCVEAYGGNNSWETRPKYIKYVTEAKRRGLSCGVTEVFARKTCREDEVWCNQTQLCTFATIGEAGDRKWNQTRLRHVALAKRRGLTCGVTEVVARPEESCTNDPAVCVPADLCRKAAYTKSGQKVWDNRSSFQKYVDEAKLRGLSCGVTVAVAKPKKTCREDAAVCSKAQLCDKARFYSNGQYTWETMPLRRQHVKEAKRRGLSCGVTYVVATPKKTCREDQSVCSDTELCTQSVTSKNGQRVWDIKPLYIDYVKEAQRRGLSCGVTGVVAKPDGHCQGNYNAATWDNCVGTQEIEEGVKYKGDFKNGQRHGLGSYIFADTSKWAGQSYFGDFKNGWPDGQGTYTHANGEKYVGQYKDGSKNGQGTATFANGNKYVGQFKDGKRNGQGTYTYANGNKYVGQFKDDKRNGHFTVTFANGDKYVGQYKDDKRNGQGTYTFADGGKYVGQFKDDRYNGQGTYSYANGDTYVGQYKDGLRNGHFKVTYADGEKYVGQFKDDKKNGQGTETYADGEKYVGQFKDDKKNGQGTETFAEGVKFVGQYEDGERHGQGILTFANGNKFVGQYKDNEQHQKGFFFFSDGRVDFCTYADGKHSNCIGTNAYDVAVTLKNQFSALPNSQRKTVQSKLKRKGLYTSSIDGKWGRGTLMALVEFSSTNLGTVGLQSASASKKLLDAVLR